MPMFLEGNRFTSFLTLVNNSTANTYADVTLRALDGSTILTQRVKFAPHSQQRFQIGDMLAQRNSLANTGSILIMQSSALAGPSIAGVLSMTYSGASDPNYIDEEPTAFGAAGSSVFQGVADRADGSPIVSIASVAKTAQHVTVDCLGEHGLIASKKIELAAGETLVTGACVADSYHGSDFESVLERADETSHGAVGIRLTSDATAPSFAAFALTPHKKHGERFFSNILFSDPKTLNSSNTVFTGVPVGSAKLLPDGRYTPQISVTNFSSKEAHVHVTFAQTSGGKPQSRDVGNISIPPMSSRDLVLKDLAGSPDLENSFLLTSDGPPGGVMAKLVSASDTALHEVELQAKDQSDMGNAGMHPWSIDGSTESTLLLFNHSTTPQNFDVSIFAGKVTWQKTWKLAPLETKAVSLRDLIQNETKDDSGNVLPKSVTSGELNWMDVNPTYGSGRLLQSDRATAMARNFSCGYAGLLCGADLDEYEETFTDGDTIDFAEIEPLTCTSGTQNACTGQRTGTGGSFSYSWGSGTTSVASIADNTSTSQTVYILGVSPGTSYISGSVRSQYCSAGGSGPANVTPLITGISPAQGLVGTAINVTISGTGFAVGTTVNAGSNISVSNVSVTSSTQITATFTPSNSTSAGGNQGVTVTAAGQTSASSNFFVQYPLHLVYINEPGLTPNNGHSATTSGTDVNIVEISGAVAATGVCGGYQWLSYVPTDQSGNQINNGTLTLSEAFSNDSPSPDPLGGTPPIGNPVTISLSGGYLGDTQAIWSTSPPACLPTSVSDSFNQVWTSKIGTVTYPLTTVIAIARSTNSQGVPSFNVSITTP